METNDKTNSVAPDPSASRPRPTMLHRLIHNMPLVVLVVLASVVVMLFGMIRSEGKEIDARKAAEKGTHRPATNVVAMEITPQRLKEHISLPGQAKPWLSLTVVAEVPGKIVEKAVAQGARVDQGDVLARIDARDYANAYASATASYEVAVSNQKRLKALFDDRVATQAQIDDIQAVVRTSKAAMDNAALDLERCTIRAPMAGVVNQIPV
ncbi:MAG: biotin/lipoyl-binding protein, partial [Desulfatitalea sp.]|nr:biotin/lipoyl-binding protein [Desulfatitalea sp.]NNK00679.1 biotin/lipoyl-binding protein [Desulfatitalea sp.]